MTTSIKTAALTLIGALAALQPAHAQAQASTDGTGASAESKAAKPSDASFRLSTGVSYSKGDYGELEDTEVISVPVSLTYKKAGLKLRVSIPWVMIDGPGSLLSTPEGRDAFLSDGRSGQGRGRGRGGDSDNSGPGSSSSGSGSSGSGSGGSEVEVEDEADDDILDDDGVTDNGGFAGADTKRSGFGDVNVSALYSFRLGGGTYFEPQIKVKLPTASKSDRLGTGEFDVTAGADLVQEFGPASIYVHASRKFAGKPTGSTIRSTWTLGGGASIEAAEGLSIGADYTWQQSAFAGRQASSEISGWINTRLARGFSVTAYAGTGFNANSADLFGGLSAGIRF